MTDLLNKVAPLVVKWQRAEITALELEELLLREGLFGVEFRKNSVTAIWNGVRLPLGD